MQARSQNRTPPQNSNTCQSKRRFTAKKLAEATAEYQMLIKPELELRVYSCGTCGGWHLTRNTDLV